MRFEEECVLIFGEVVQVFGAQKSVGQIYGLLFASRVPLSFSDIVERLDISKGLASLGLQQLRFLGAINEAGVVNEARSEKRGTKRRGQNRKDDGLLAAHSPSRFHSHLGDSDAPRRIAYVPEHSLRRLMSGVLQKQVKPLTAAASEPLVRLRELAESVRQAQDGADSDFYLDRVKQLESWRRKFKTVLPVLSAFLGPKDKK